MPDRQYQYQGPGTAGLKMARRLAVAVALMVHVAAGASPTVTSLAFARAGLQYCPLEFANFNQCYEKGEEKRSWEGDGFNLAASVESGPLRNHTLNASSAVDLATGSLRASTWAIGIEPRARAYGSADMRLGDTLTLLNPDGTPYGGGGMSNVHLDISGFYAVTEAVDLLAGIYVQVFRPGYFEDFSKLVFESTPFAQRIVMLEPGGTLPTSLDLSFLADGPFEVELGIFASYNFVQDVDQTQFVAFDLGHTITASFNGPAGTRFSSASGLFPGSSTATSVHEPAGALLVLIGFGLLIATRGRAAGRGPAQQDPGLIGTRP